MEGNGNMRIEDSDCDEEDCDVSCEEDFDDLLNEDTDSVVDFIPEDIFTSQNREEGKIYTSFLHLPRSIWENADERIDDATDEHVLALVAKDDEAEKKLLDQKDSVFNWSNDFINFTGRSDTWKLWEREVPEYNCPYESFLSIWNQEIMQKIADETNRYAKAKILRSKKPNRQWKDTNVNELYLLFGVFYMITWMDDVISMHFSKEEHFCQMPILKKCISEKRVKALVTCLHFVDNDKIAHLKDVDLQVAKIKPLTDYISNKFESLKNLNENISIYDSMPHLSGQSVYDYYNAKSTGIGKRLYELSDAPTGYVWRVLADPGRETDSSVDIDYGYNTNIVLKMTEGIHNKGHTLLIDNCLNSPVLARHLKKKGIDVVGPVRSCHVHVPQVLKDLMNNENIKKGHCVSIHCEDLSINTYVQVIRSRYFVDSLKFNNILSTFHNDSMDKSKKNKPEALLFYNGALSRLDSREEEFNEHGMPINLNNKWYILAFSRLLKVTAWNCFVLYCRQVQEGKKMLPFSTYEQYLGKFLIKLHMTPDFHNEILEKARTRPGKHIIVSVKKFDCKENFNREKKWQCEYCKRRGVENYSEHGCRECHIALCVTPCFEKFHMTESDYDYSFDSSEDMVGSGSS